MAGRRVLVVDLDPQASSTWVLGHDPGDGRPSTADVMATSRSPITIVTSHWAADIDLVPSSPTLQAHESGSPEHLRRALHKVAAGYDAVLIDCPPSLGNLTMSGLIAADMALIVVEPAALGLRGIGAVADAIDEVWDAHNSNLELAGVIVNKVPAISAEAERRYEIGRAHV